MQSSCIKSHRNVKPSHWLAPHVEIIGREVSTSFTHEDKSNVICNSFQNLDFDDVMVNLESVIF
jgi:hypothetical protein